jgi:dTDP-L-rhamnose 4-epimerase
VASIFRSALAAGRAPEVYEDGAQARDFVSVFDVARANVLALTADVATPGVAVNIASGTPHTVADMAWALSTAVDASLAPVTTGKWRLGDVRHVVASPTRAAEVLGFVAEVGFADGMADFAAAAQRA